MIRLAGKREDSEPSPKGNTKKGVDSHLDLDHHPDGLDDMEVDDTSASSSNSVKSPGESRSSQAGIRVLIVAYTFPPWGGLGSLRTVHMANQLAAENDKVDVLTIRLPEPRPGQQFAPVPAYDRDSVALVSPGVKILRSYPGLLFILRPRLQSILRTAPGSRREIGLIKRFSLSIIRRLILPISSLEWIAWGLLAGCRMALRERYEVVYSTDNPVSCRIVGFFVKVVFSIPWVLYIGDPYSFGAVEQLRPHWRLGIDKVIDSLFLPHADRIIVNCEETMNGYLHRFPRLERERFQVITDGFDEKRYNSIESLPVDHFRIVYTGTLYAGSRDLDRFFRALPLLHTSPIEVVVAGTIDPSVKSMIDSLAMTHEVHTVGFQPHDKVVALQKGATVLLLAGWSAGYQIPGKVFEYFGARRPILAIRSDEMDLGAKLVEKQRRGIVVEDDLGKILAALEKLSSLWREGRLDGAFDLSELKEYSWGGLAPAFGSLLRELVGPSA